MKNHKNKGQETNTTSNYQKGNPGDMKNMNNKNKSQESEMTKQSQDKGRDFDGKNQKNYESEATKKKSSYETDEDMESEKHEGSNSKSRYFGNHDSMKNSSNKKCDSGTCEYDNKKDKSARS